MTQWGMLRYLQYSWLGSLTVLRSLPAWLHRPLHRVAIYSKQFSVFSDDRLETDLRCPWRLPRQLQRLHFQRRDRWEGIRLPWARSRLRDSTFRYLPRLRGFRGLARHLLSEMRVFRRPLRKDLNGPRQDLELCLGELPRLRLLLSHCLVNLRPVSRDSLRILHLRVYLA